MNKSLWLLIPLSLVFFSSCDKKVQTAMEPSLLDQICEVETTRHQASHQKNLVFINNPYMDAYGETSGSPQLVLESALQRDDVCRDSFLQLLGRYHPDFILQEHETLLSNLKESDWLQILNGLKSRQKTVDRSLIMKLISAKHSNDMRIATIRWIGPDFSAGDCDLIQGLWGEKDPDIISEWISVLSPKACSQYLPFIKSLFTLEDENLQQTILMVLGQYEFEGRDELISRYLNHRIPSIRKMAQALQNSLAEKPTLTLTAHIATSQKTDFGLRKAFEKGDFEKIKGAYEAGADPDTPVDGNDSMLLFLAAKKRPVSKSPPIQHITSEGWEKLRLQNQTQTLELANLLLEKGANPNFQDGLGRSVLFHAVMTQTNYLIPLLLDHGADPFLGNVDGVTPLALAQLMENQGAIKFMKTRLQPKP